MFLWPLLVGKSTSFNGLVCKASEANPALVGVGSLFPPVPGLRRVIYVGKSIIVSSHVSVVKNILDFSGGKESRRLLLCPCSCWVLNCNLHWLTHFLCCVLNNLCCETYSMVMIPDVPGELCEDDSEVLAHCIKPSVALVEAEKLFLFLKVLIKSSQLKCL